MPSVSSEPTALPETPELTDAQFAWLPRAAEKREAVVCAGGPEDVQPALETTVTISSHDYHINYYAGSLPYVEARTRCLLAHDAAGLHVRLELDEPYLEQVLAGLARQDDSDLGKVEFVALNALLPGGAVRQFLFKADGRFRTTRDGQTEDSAIEPRCERVADGWRVTFTCPWSLLGTSAEAFAERPIPFDLVRHRAALGTVTAWSPIPDHPPFSERYRYPVFHFGLLAAAPGAWERFAPATIDTGRLAFAGPSTITAGEYVRLRYTYTVGARGLAPGGGLRFALHNEVIECNRRSPVVRHLPEKDWSPLQWHDPGQPGYLAATCSRPGAPVVFAKDDLFAVTARLAGTEPLAPGDTITIEVGSDPRGPGLRAQLLTQSDLRFKFYVDALGHDVWHDLEAPALNVVGGPAQRLLLHAPATPRPGEPLPLRIVAIDRYGNLTDSYRGSVRLYGPEGVQGLPETVTFTAAVARVAPTLPADVVGVFRAVDRADAALNGESNLVVTTGEFGDHRIVFGDIHTHSQGSDGRLLPREKVREVRDLRGCDCWALTDHCHDLTPARQRHQNELLDEAEEPGVFAALPAYEWSNSMGEKRPWVRPWLGHRNVYFADTPLVVRDGVAEASNTVERLKTALTATGRAHAIVNHFHCGDATHVPGADDGAEISGWATSFLRDTPGGDGYLGDVLDTEADVAVVAGSDHGTEAYYHGLPAELTAFYVSTLDRRQVFDALKSGRTYASTGVRTLLWVAVNGRGPHQGHTRVRAAERTLEIRVGSHLPVIGIQILRNGKVAKNLGGFDFGVRRFTWRDPEPTGRGYYLIRVNVAQGHHVWSSPIYYENG